MSEKILQFRVKAGLKHGQGSDKEAEGGDIVLLTAEQASGFMDKLEPIDDDGRSVSDAAFSLALESKTIAQLKQMDEYKDLPAPKPVGKKKIIAAILEVSGAK